MQKHTPTDSMCVTNRILIFRIAAGFGTLNKQVAGFHRAVPSTALDKACMQLLNNYKKPKKKSQAVSSKYPTKVHNSDIDFFGKS